MEEEIFQLVKAKPIEDEDEINSIPEYKQTIEAEEGSDDDLALVPKKKVKRQPHEETLFNELSNQLENVEVTPAGTQGEYPENNEEILTKPKLQKPKKALSGYFLFLKDYKSREDKGNMTSVNIHKDLSTIWSTMNMDEKQKYVAQAQEEQKRYNAEMEIYKASLGENDEGGSDHEETHQSLVTLGKIKRIIKADPEIRKVSKAGYESVIKLTEAFGAYLLQEVEKSMKAEKKKKPGMTDLVNVSKKVPGLMFLDDANIFPDYEGQKLEKEMRIRTEKESKKKAQRENPEDSVDNIGEITDKKEKPEPRKTAEKEKKKVVANVSNNKKISDFFGRNNQ